MPEDIKGKRMLIVDDSNTNLKILGGYLEAWGLNYDTAQSAEVALKLLNAVSKVGAPYDLVITDMQMPGMDGAELGEAIKADPALEKIRMIMLTSRGIRGDASMMRKMGFDGYLTKPVRRSQLHDCIITVLSKGPLKGKGDEQQLVTRHAIVDNKIILELKSVLCITRDMYSQLLNYLHVSCIRAGILLISGMLL